jgi:SAM-dependent methyltransferase
MRSTGVGLAGVQPLPVGRYLISGAATALCRLTLPARAPRYSALISTPSGSSSRGRRSDYPALVGRVRFENVDLAALNIAEDFDLIVSKDTFEHIADLPGMMATIYRSLKPNGELWAGFSPLFFSPWGDHARTGLRLPWAHAVLPRSVVLKAASRHNGRVVSTLDSIGLNGVTPRGFRRMARDAGFDIVSVSYNRGDKRLLPVLSRARRVPALERWATVSIYAVLRRPANRR